MQSLRRAACIFLMRDSKVLVVSRKDNPNDFGLPGGKCNEGESFEDAAVRELKEETGLIAYDLRFVFARRDSIFIVKTFTPDKCVGDIFTEEETKAKNEGVVKWVSFDKFLKGTFVEYNTKLLESLGLI